VDFNVFHTSIDERGPDLVLGRPGGVVVRDRDHPVACRDIQHSADRPDTRATPAGFLVRYRVASHSARGELQRCIIPFRAFDVFVGRVAASNVLECIDERTSALEETIT
jgi:hypothetical protein